MNRSASFLKYGPGLCYTGLCTVGLGRVSSVGIATGCGLDGPGIESRWGAIFSASVMIGPGAMGAGSISLG